MFKCRKSPMFKSRVDNLQCSSLDNVQCSSLDNLQCSSLESTISNVQVSTISNVQVSTISIVDNVVTNSRNNHINTKSANSKYKKSPRKLPTCRQKWQALVHLHEALHKTPNNPRAEQSKTHSRKTLYFP